MRIPSVVQGVLVAGLAVGGCSGRTASLPGNEGTDGGGSGGLVSSAAGMAAMPVPSTSGSGGLGDGGVAGSATGGSAGASSGAGSGGVAGSIAGGGGVGGAVDPITQIVPTPGCGLSATQTPGMSVRGTIQTMGTKDADCADKLHDGSPRCGPWSYLRDYWVMLPLGYDNTKPYPLVFQAPGCATRGDQGYRLNTQNNGLPANNNVDSSVIRIGLTAPPPEVGQRTIPDVACYDDAEGDDSVEWPFFNDLYDQLAAQLCFDKSRVFANGSGSSAARFVDELACKYAGDEQRPIRGVISNNGDWHTEPQYLPTCSTKPMAGMWVHQEQTTERLWSSAKLAIARAMTVDGCTIGTGYDDATFDDFPIGGGNPDTTCKRIKGCSELTPLVVCLLPGTQRPSNDKIVDPGASAFIKLFESPPLLSK